MTAKLTGADPAKRLSQAEARTKGPATQAKRTRIKKTTERELLGEMVAKLNQNKGALPQIMDVMLAKAKGGDRDALAFIGKYLLGNGKVSLDELYNPPLIKPSRR